jgi:predicted TIM-barrel fold metal-dependent hydrolase
MKLLLLIKIPACLVMLLIKGALKSKKTMENSDVVATGLFSPVIIMPMDMDFAHIAGFPPESSRIYHEGVIPHVSGTGAPLSLNYGNPTSVPPPATNTDGVYCYERKDGTAPENKGEFIDVSNEKPNHIWAHQRYKRQYASTIEAVKKNPWQIIPMFHYDPRRWCQDSGGKFDKDSWATGPWDFPFRFTATQKNAGLFIGFKMYPPLGYKPLDKRLPNLERFYARCEEDGIPVLAHCSPGGMCTHEAKYYYQLDKADLSKQAERVISVSYDPCTPLGYFYDNYVHPQTWRPVLMKYPKLKLCLAHFGGVEWDDEKGTGLASDWVEEINKMCNPDIVQGQGPGGPVKFENVYTDIACQDIDNSSVRKNMYRLFSKMGKDDHYRHLQNKLLFGVDWYLSILTKAPEYRTFSEMFFDMMNDCDPWQWYRSSLVNAAIFYGLDDANIIKNMNDALNKNITSKKDILKCTKNFEQVKKIKEQMEGIRKDIQNAQSEGQK